jgi:hypothetical protein
VPLAITPSGASLEGARLPFAEQAEFFRNKLGNLIPTARWDDIRHGAHDAGFMVAGAAKADLLADLAGAVDRVIAEGKSIQWFRQNFQAIAARHGWAGYTGDGSAAGIAWRTRVIYQANLLTSYAAGRLAQLRDPELQKLAPYWMYWHSESVMRPRPLHLSWHKLTLPADHPWFKSHYPPNGWGCHCRIIAVSRAQAERDGARFIAPPDDGIDPKTGIPRGIDKGFGYMPGDTVADALRQTLETKAAKLPAPLAAALRDDLAKIADNGGMNLVTSLATRAQSMIDAGLGKEALFAGLWANESAYAAHLSKRLKTGTVADAADYAERTFGVLRNAETATVAKPPDGRAISAKFQLSNGDWVVIFGGRRGDRHILSFRPIEGGVRGKPPTIRRPGL